VVVPFQQRVHELLADPGTLDDVLARGCGARPQVAAPTLADVLDRVGFLPAGTPP
jgi:tryptophanyl-tRNA synthetase